MRNFELPLQNNATEQDTVILHENKEGLAKFEELDPINKVRAILAVQTEPISQEIVFGLAGISKESLTVEETGKITTFLDGNATEKSQGEYSQEYLLADEDRREIESRIDTDSVEEHLMHTMKDVLEDALGTAI